MKFEVGGEGWVREFKAATGPLRREWTITDSESEQEHQVHVEPIDSQVLRLTIGGASHTLTILPGNRPGQPLRFLLDDEYKELQVRDESDLLSELLGGPGGSSGAAEIVSPMPGVIRKLLVAPGDSVEADQPLLILEAMKMENEVRAPQEGVVESLAVAEGDTVGAGDTLATLESESE